MIRPLLNRLFQPLLQFVGIPSPLCPDTETFATAAFPPREFPLSVWDWRDVVAYLVASPILHDSQTKTKTKGTRKRPPEMYRVAEVGRYTFAEAGEGEHQVVVAKVEVGDGLYKLLRIERGRGVSDLEVNSDAAFANVRSKHLEVPMQDPRKATDEENALGPVSGSRPASPASEAIQQIPRTPEPEPAQSPGPIAPTSPHPSISVYNINTLAPVRQGAGFSSLIPRRLANLRWMPHKAHKANDDEEKIGSRLQANSDIDVDTVQTIFESDLRALELTESLQPRDFYLHHLALLVGEVHDYNPRHVQPAPVILGPHQCTLFAELIMCVLAKEMGVVPTTAGPAAAADPRNREKVVDDIVSSYRTLKDDLGRRIANAVGEATPAEKQKQSETQNEPRARPSTQQESHIQIKREEVVEHEHIEVADVHV